MADESGMKRPIREFREICDQVDMQIAALDRYLFHLPGQACGEWYTDIPSPGLGEPVRLYARTRDGLIEKILGLRVPRGTRSQP